MFLRSCRCALWESEKNAETGAHNEWQYIKFTSFVLMVLGQNLKAVGTADFGFPHNDMKSWGLIFDGSRWSNRSKCFVFQVCQRKSPGFLPELLLKGNVAGPLLILLGVCRLSLYPKLLALVGEITILIDSIPGVFSCNSWVVIGLFSLPVSRIV